MTKYKLKNGLQVILAPQQETQAVTVLVLVGVGSRYENDDLAGISHFLEHMIFKGTPRRPNTLSLTKELDQVGAEFNAFTIKDHTGYWIKINAEHLELALDLLADMIFNSKLEAKEIAQEKGTIIEEINMYEDNPMNKSLFLLDHILFKGNSLARDEGGDKKTVKSITRRKMVNFKNKHYYPQNTVITIAGNINLKEIKKNINQHFNKKLINKKKIKFKKFKSNQKKAQITLEYKDTAQAHLAFGFPGPSYRDPDLPATQILSVILGGSMSSRLFIKVREQQGLCYYIKSAINTYQDTGNFLIRAGLDKSRITPAISIILKELQKIKTKGITAEELKRAQEFIKGKMILELEDSSSVAEWYGKQQLLEYKTQTPEQKIKQIMQVRQVEVNQVARRMFQTGKINLVLIGPFKDEQPFRKLLKL